MDSDYRGYAVGPAADADALRRQLVSLSPAPLVSLHQLAPGSVWCALELERHALEVAMGLPRPAYVFEIELHNGIDGADAHGGLIIGQRIDEDGEAAPITREEIWEEGLVQGGVLPEVALDYLSEHIRGELLHPDVPAPEDSEGDADSMETLARELVGQLVDGGQLELVNHHGRRTLVGPIMAVLDSGQAISEIAAAL
ncbi:MAG: hypothetical protein JRI68_34220, partial [Deltaproteobacteria bacterium]|nr:hypothetical protein [Deltaproteobacteria bacterium]